MQYKVKIITGFDNEQHYTIDAEESHKAYYLFRNPTKRGVFENGLALIGKDIRAIQPDYHSTMGWNTTHVLASDDWNELSGKNVIEKLKHLMGKAKDVSYIADENPLILGKKLSEIESTDTDLLFPGINKLIT